VVGTSEDPIEVMGRILNVAERLRVPISHIRYDAAGIQSMRSAIATTRKRRGFERVKTTKIPFAKYKREAILYERLLMKRTALGKTTRIMAIHPDNVELLRQLRSWEFKKNKSTEEATEEVDKGDDHGPDAVLAGIAPIAARHRAYIEKMIARAKNIQHEEEPEEEEQ
jgi:hypothetical protein